MHDILAFISLLEYHNWGSWRIWCCVEMEKKYKEIEQYFWRENKINTGRLCKSKNLKASRVEGAP